MPKITIEPANRGLVQETGSVVVGGVQAAQTVSGGSAIKTTGFVVQITAAAGQTGVLDAGVSGQLIVVTNVGTNAITISATRFAGGLVDLGAGLSMLCVWDDANSKWSPTTQTMA